MGAGVLCIMKSFRCKFYSWVDACIGFIMFVILSRFNVFVLFGFLDFLFRLFQQKH